jgi:hypothetical protein
MRRTTRNIARSAVLAFAVLGVAACGAGSSKTVAQVAGVGTISESSLEHWIQVEARLLYAAVPKRPVPEGAVPSPPSYTACIAYLSTLAQSQKAEPKQTTAQLKGKCSEQYAQLKQSVLNLLISWDWTIGDGAAAGFHVTEAQARQRVVEDEKTELLGVPVSKYLEYSGQTLADLLLRDRVQLLKVKLEQRLIAFAKRLPTGLTEQQRLAALTKLESPVRTPAQWVTLTSCRPGYVVSSCRQYKGSSSASAPN